VAVRGSPGETLTRLPVGFLIYETKGLSLEQVDEMYNEPGLTAHQSVHWKPSKTFKERASVAGQGGVVGRDGEKAAVDHDHSPDATTRHHEAVAPEQRV